MAKAHERKRQILALLMESPTLSVAELSGRFNVSEVTIRNDLKDLAAQGLVVRHHGGGLPAFHAHVLERQRTRIEEKTRIARAAAELIADSDDVMLTAGTTTSLIPRFLLGRRDVKIVTNSTLLLPYVRNNPGVQVTLTGGEFKPALEAMTGPATLRELQKYHVDKAFLGSDGISLAKGITADNAEIAEICRLMSEQAQQTIVLADSSKLGRAGFAHIMDATRIDILITDEHVAKAEVSRLRNKGIEVRLV